MACLKYRYILIVQFNPFVDNLLLSAGGDDTVRIWYALLIVC